MSTAYLLIPSVDCNTQFKHSGTPIELVPQSLKNIRTTKETENKHRKTLGNQIQISRSAYAELASKSTLTFDLQFAVHLGLS